MSHGGPVSGGSLFNSIVYFLVEVIKKKKKETFSFRLFAEDLVSNGLRDRDCVTRSEIT